MKAIAGAPPDSRALVEHYKLLLEDAGGLRFLHGAAVRLARAEVPANISDALGLARVTALSKPNGGVNPATGKTLRRLVARALAKDFAEVFDAATRRYTSSRSRPGRALMLAALLRAITDTDAEATVLSLDGRSTYGTDFAVP